MNILIIEDDIYLAQRLKNVFEKKVITNRIKIITSYIDFTYEMPLIHSYDIILTDIILWENEEKTWMNIIECIRDKNINTPIVVMSSFHDMQYIEKAFDLWANDYITKPFRLQELEIRVLKWFKTFCFHTISINKNILQYHELVYNFDTNIFKYNGEKLDLTKKAKFILFVLLLNFERLVTESALKEKIWWDNCITKDRNLRVNILRLKWMLHEYWIDQWIVNARWEWYILQKP